MVTAPIVGIFFCGAFAGPPPPPPPPPSVESRSGPTRTTSGLSILRPGPLPFDGIRQGLHVRLPRLRVLPYEAGSFDIAGDQDYAYVELIGTSDPGAPVDIEVILQDGRSYARRFVPDTDDPVRSTVTVLANLLTAIEEERVQPVRKDAKIPVLGDAARPEEPEPAHEREPTPKPKPRVARARPWSLGVTPRFGTVVGLAPQRTFAGGSVGLDLMGRAPVGAIVVAGFRWTTRARAGFRLQRLRLELGGGYAWRRESFEVVTAVAFVVEPALLSGDDTVRWVERADGQRAGPLVGGLARVSPGLFLQPSAAPGVAVRLGLFAELAGSVLRSGAAGRVTVGSGDAVQEVARYGGLELAAGVDATVWFALRRR